MSFEEPFYLQVALLSIKICFMFCSFLRFIIAKNHLSIFPWAEFQRVWRAC